MNNEMLAMLEYLESERGLSRETLVALIEEAIVASARKALGTERELHVKINPKSGDIAASTRKTVVEQVANADEQVPLKDALRRFPDAKPGDEVEWEIPPSLLGRIVAQTAKQAIMQRLRQAEKLQIADEFREKIGTLLTGIVRKIERGDVYIDFQRTEGIMRHGDRIPGEDYAPGDHIAALLTGVNADKPGPCLEVSRSHPDFVRALFEREVSEISEGLVTIRAIAREPGYRTKMAVEGSDPRVDPVGACVGIRGTRVKNIVRELAGEKIDIIPWNDNVAAFVGNALQPAKVGSVKIDQETKTVEVTVPEDQLSLAIGKRGQNARLAARLTGWRIDINRVEAKAPEELGFEDKVQRATEALARIPGIGAETAAILVKNGFLTLEGILAAEADDLAAIDGITPERAAELLAIARQQTGS
ncbi:MAG: transcription termination factor NusA [Lentisphaeria bacterium]